jgi:hypothetical protein
VSPWLSDSEAWLILEDAQGAAGAKSVLEALRWDWRVHGVRGGCRPTGETDLPGLAAW